MSSIEGLTRRVSALTAAVDYWNAAMVWALVIAAFAAIAVVVTTRITLGRAKQLGDAQGELLRAKDAELAINLKEKDLRIAEATARANEATLELAKYKAPRSLNAEQAAHVATAMKAFTDMRFDGAVGPINDPEPLLLFDQIAATLTAAGWTHIPWRATSDMRLSRSNGTPDLGGISVTNVIVDIHPSHAARLWPAAQALASVLTIEGIAADAQQGAGGAGNKNDLAIHILIGRKL